MTGETKRGLILGVVGLVVGLLLGVWPTLSYQRGQIDQRVDAATAEQQERLAEVEEALAFADLHSELGVVMLQAHRLNFGIAQRQGAAFFQRVGEFARAAEDPQRAELARELAERQGELLGDLAASSPGAAEELGNIYLEWQEALGAR
jgi:hypothetical protein